MVHGAVPARPVAGADPDRAGGAHDPLFGAIEVLKLDHVRTARAKGLSETRVILAHGLRNALIPVVTLIGLQVGYLLGGAVVTETIFSWPGLGRLAVGAILPSDFTITQGTIMLFALGFITVNLIVDILYSILDPRVRK